MLWVGSPGRYHMWKNSWASRTSKISQCCTKRKQLSPTITSLLHSCRNVGRVSIVLWLLARLTELVLPLKEVILDIFWVSWGWLSRTDFSFSAFKDISWIAHLAEHDLELYFCNAGNVPWPAEPRLTRSLQISEANHGQPELGLGWETTKEALGCCAEAENGNPLLFISYLHNPMGFLPPPPNRKCVSPLGDVQNSPKEVYSELSPPLFSGAYCEVRVLKIAPLKWNPLQSYSSLSSLKSLVLTRKKFCIGCDHIAASGRRLSCRKQSPDVPCGGAGNTGQAWKWTLRWQRSFPGLFSF